MMPNKLKIVEAIESVADASRENVGDLSSGMADDAVQHLIRHWRDAVDGFGESGLTGKDFKKSFIEDITDAVNALVYLRGRARNIVVLVEDSEVYLNAKESSAP